jgi:ketosteroid isomerase-like protein
MSQENVETALALFAASNPLGELAPRMAPEVEFDFSAIYPDQPVLRGVAEMRRFRDESPWGRSMHFEPQRYFDVDDERVLVFVRATATGQGSGAPTETAIAHEFSFRDGEIVRIKVYLDRAQALKASGLAG